MATVETVATTRITGADLHALIESERESGEKLYGVVDAARDNQLAFDGARQFGWELQWLFTEDTAQQMRDVAPYLVPITFESSYPYQESAYLDLWAERLGSSAGILLLTAAGPKDLWNHLRTVFSFTEEDEDYYFRFYDPRVLRPLLPACSGDDVAQYFGLIRVMLVEAETPGKLLCCRPIDSKVEVEEKEFGQSKGNFESEGRGDAVS